MYRQFLHPQQICLISPFSCSQISGPSVLIISTRVCWISKLLWSNMNLEFPLLILLPLQLHQSFLAQSVYAQFLHLALSLFLVFQY